MAVVVRRPATSGGGLLAVCALRKNHNRALSSARSAIEPRSYLSWARRAVGPRRMNASPGCALAVPKRRGLTLRSSGLPPARHLARAPVNVIIRRAGQAPCRRQPLNSNVRFPKDPGAPAREHERTPLMPSLEFSPPVATVLAALFAGALLLYVHRLNTYRAASVKFRSAVLSALTGLYPYPVSWPRNGMAIDEVLRSAFPSLQQAVAEFRPFVPWWRRPAFDRAWRIYRLGEDGREVDQQYYWQYIPHSGSGIADGRTYEHDNRLTYRDSFKQNVEALLRFARET